MMLFKAVLLFFMLFGSGWVVVHCTCRGMHFCRICGEIYDSLKTGE